MKLITKERVMIHGWGLYPEMATVYKILGRSPTFWYLAIIAILVFIIIPLLRGG